MTTANESAQPITVWDFLNIKWNPAKDERLATVPVEHLREACGIIPDFFVGAVLEGAETLEGVSEGMDTAYSFGGFCYPLGGQLLPQGVYQSPYEEDEPLAPLVRLDLHTNLELFIYQYGVAALRDRSTGAFKVGRFD